MSLCKTSPILSLHVSLEKEGHMTTHVWQIQEDMLTEPNAAATIHSYVTEAIQEVVREYVRTRMT